MAIDPEKLNEFLGRALVDFGATFHAALVRIGDKLGLYKALAAGGPQTSGELAKRTNTTERYIREWFSTEPGSPISLPSSTPSGLCSKTKTYSHRAKPLSSRTW